MDKRSGRTVFWLGLLLYAASFILSFVGGRGVYTPKPPSGADCAFDWFFFPWIYVHFHSMTIAISGWINRFFFLAVLLQVIGKTLELTRILRNVIRLMFPFCWIVFLHQHVHPRGGYFLWIGGMLLVLFSSQVENRRSA